MRFAAHLYLWHDRTDTDALLALLARCPALGLDLLEIPVGDDVTFDAARVGQAARDLGIGLITSPGGVWPMACDLSLPGAAARAHALAWHLRELDRAAACGAIAYTGALYGHPGRVDRQVDPQTEWPRIAEALAELAAAAAERRLELVLEPMSHFRTHLVTTPAQAMALITLAGAPSNLRVLADTYHLASEVGDMAAAILPSVARLWGLHACENNRGCPGTGLIPWRDLLSQLQAHHWDGIIGLEAYNTTWQNGTFARSRGLVQPVCPDGDAFVRQARQHLLAAASPGH